MKIAQYISHVIFLAALLGCYPEAEIAWEDPTAVDPDLPPPLPEPREAALVEAQATPLGGDCPAVVSGEVATLAGIGAGGQLGVGEAEIKGRPDEPFLSTELAVELALAARERPLSVGCFETALIGGLPAAGAAAGVGGIVRHAASILGDAAWNPVSSDRGTFEDAVTALCARYLPEPEIDPATGEERPIDLTSFSCGTPVGELPPDLASALAPVMWAIHDGVVARLELDEAHEARDPDFWRDFGGNGLLASRENEGFNAEFPEDRAYLSRSRGKLYGAAAAIADAIEAVDWSVFRGRAGVSFDLETPAGFVRVRGSENDQYPPSEQDTLLLIDLGGDDVHLDEVASNTSGENAVSVLVDLDGADLYTYPEAMGAPLDAPRLPLDADGAVDVPGQVAGGSASTRGRQGAARNGIALLFDFGGSADRYVALRASQGYAHQGVGVLFDDGGEDEYAAEHSAQGAGQFGIGLLVDLGQDPDVRRSSFASQGFGYTRGVGLLFDEGGDDRYECHLDNGGRPAYPAPQTNEETNASMCQGAGLGFRIRQPELTSHSLPGGVGLLVDLAGDDVYRAAVYAQGTGYWQGLGILSDRSGSDSYDALYYAQGAAAHFGAGFLADGGPGSDRFGLDSTPINLVVGAAQDFSVGVLVNEHGDDEYRLPPLAGGAASCGSVTLFVDNGGADRYVAPSPDALGVALASACGTNTQVTSTALFMDVGGADTFEGGTSAGNDLTWGRTYDNDPGARAFARDLTTGDSGIHVGPR